MELDKFIESYLLSSGIPLPPNKSIKDAVTLFKLGYREAGWTYSLAAKFTNAFPDKQKGRRHHYIWALDACGMKHCPSCDSALDLEEFHDNSSKRAGKQSICIDCYKADQQRHPDRWRAYAAARKAAKLKATPAWANLLEIKDFYKNCPEGYHVDHIVPLQGDSVCGLHVLNNLQYLLAEDNLKKSNKLL